MSTDKPATPPPARSYLFVPGDRPERFMRAWDSAADQVILDLEDAVAPENKAAARRAIAGWLDPARPVWIRVNAIDDAGFAEDLALCQRPGVAGLLLPKAQTIPFSLVDTCVTHGLHIVPIIESAAGMHAVEAIASMPGVARLAFGALDFMVDLDINDDVGDALLYFRSRLVLASRLGGLPAPIDGVTPSVDDAALLRHDAERSRRLGFGAKLCIHPKQIAEVHRALAPRAEERVWAQRALETFALANGAAVAMDGKMIDRPVWLKAQRIAATPLADVRLRA